MRFRGANPVYSRTRIEGGAVQATYGGVTLKTGILLGIIAIVAIYFGSTLEFSTNYTGAIITAIVAPIIAIISIIVMHRNPAIAPVMAFVYSMAEGVFLGFISALYASYFGNDIILTALAATFGVFFGMLFLYNTGIIRVGPYFRRFLFTALIGLILGGFIVFGLAIFGGLSTGIGYSLYVTIVIASVIIASLYLLVDFDNVTKYIEAGAGKQNEWMLAIGLVVTIVWLYIEILRLVAILSRRR